MPISSPFARDQYTTIIGGTVAQVPTDYGSQFVYQASLDLSKIESINILFSSYYGRTLNWVDGNCNNIGVIYNNGSMQVPSGAKGLKLGSNEMADFRITSFTTTDGKVHTADNLNY